MREFVEAHWHDLIALFVLLLGVSLVLLGAFIPDARVSIGGELIGAGLLGLGLRPTNNQKPKKEGE